MSVFSVMLDGIFGPCYAITTDYIPRDPIEEEVEWCTRCDEMLDYCNCDDPNLATWLVYRCPDCNRRVRIAAWGLHMCDSDDIRNDYDERNFDGER